MLWYQVATIIGLQHSGISTAPPLSDADTDQLRQVKAAADFLVLDEPVRLAYWVRVGLQNDELLCSSGTAVPQLYYAALLKQLLHLDQVQFGVDVAVKLAQKLGRPRQWTLMSEDLPTWGQMFAKGESGAEFWGGDKNYQSTPGSFFGGCDFLSAPMHENLLSRRTALNGITRSGIDRLCRVAGVAASDDLIYAETHSILKAFLEAVLWNAVRSLPHTYAITSAQICLKFLTLSMAASVSGHLDI
eukprot:SAG31_NODE_2113_length_6422_cov_2.860035_6_plen_245_part_00